MGGPQIAARAWIVSRRVDYMALKYHRHRGTGLISRHWRRAKRSSTINARKRAATAAVVGLAVNHHLQGWGGPSPRQAGSKRRRPASAPPPYLAGPRNQVGQIPAAPATLNRAAIQGRTTLFGGEQEGFAGKRSWRPRQTGCAAPLRNCAAASAGWADASAIHKAARRARIHPPSTAGWHNLAANHGPHLARQGSRQAGPWSGWRRWRGHVL